MTLNGVTSLLATLLLKVDLLNSEGLSNSCGLSLAAARGSYTLEF